MRLANASISKQIIPTIDSVYGVLITFRGDISHTSIATLYITQPNTMVHGRFIVYTLYPDKAQTMAYQMAADQHVYAFSPRLRHPITWPLATVSFITYKRAIFYYKRTQGEGETESYEQMILSQLSSGVEQLGTKLLAPEDSQWIRYKKLKYRVDIR